MNNLSDLTMCRGTYCPFKDVCYRHKAPKGVYEYCFAVTPYNIETGRCEYYLSIPTDKDKLDRGI